ncbi:hypothetical protein D7207_41630 [Burkholderia cepacia]|nr:hypothetical protein [Burkholderia cepacia]MBA9943427.1 hypothetical protein [Burkholderia cepacia]MBA9973337.1 hypothetical protein [Burkholderia cepacia]MBA9991897.1 hypothetical protein [Burkholderia cepacia]MBB0002111.1 hypothetical protein [Burkholderia cepacia]
MGSVMGGAFDDLLFVNIDLRLRDQVVLCPKRSTSLVGNGELRIKSEVAKRTWGQLWGQLSDLTKMNRRLARNRRGYCSPVPTTIAFSAIR